MNRSISPKKSGHFIPIFKKGQEMNLPSFLGN